MKLRILRTMNKWFCGVIITPQILSWKMFKNDTVWKVPPDVEGTHYPLFNYFRRAFGGTDDT